MHATGRGPGGGTSQAVPLNIYCLDPQGWGLITQCSPWPLHLFSHQLGQFSGEWEAESEQIWGAHGEGTDLDRVLQLLTLI